MILLRALRIGMLTNVHALQNAGRVPCASGTLSCDGSALMVYPGEDWFEFVVIERFGGLMVEFPVPGQLFVSKDALNPELAINGACPWVGWRRQAPGSRGASSAGLRTLKFHDHIHTEFRPVLDLDHIHLYIGDCDELFQEILGCGGWQVVRRREWLGYLW